jgi:hypothetical protein
LVSVVLSCALPIAGGTAAWRSSDLPEERPGSTEQGGG